MVNVLHFWDGANGLNVRLQRFVQCDLDMGLNPTVFVNSTSAQGDNKWIPDIDKVTVETFEKSRKLTYMLPVLCDHLGLKRVFRKHGCSMVHAHNLPCAYYSHKLGLPTLFNDWEYFYEHYDYATSKLSSTSFKTHRRRILSMPFKWYRRKIAKTVMKKLLRELPIIVTNKTVEKKYRQLGAKRVWTVPNVPCKFEVDTALNCVLEKRRRTTTCYVGNMSNDNQTTLRNTSGIRELWSQKGLGDLLVLEGSQYVPHLQIFKILSGCHFNLLYWHPLDVHRYYLQNKAFLASIMGVPTIISDSLKATINLLGEYAILVHDLDEIEEVVQSDMWRVNGGQRPKPSHVFEFYTKNVLKAYAECD